MTRKSNEVSQDAWNGMCSLQVSIKASTFVIFYKELIGLINIFLRSRCHKLIENTLQFEVTALNCTFSITTESYVSEM
jgi:hypothetical protein